MINIGLELTIGLEEVFLVDNCLITRLTLEELRNNPRAYFTTKRVLEEHARWKEIESKPFSEKKQRPGHLFKLNEIEKPLTRIEEIIKSREYQDIGEAARICDELEVTQTKDFEIGLIYLLKHLNIRFDLTGDEAQKDQVRKYFTELQQTRALLLEEYSIKIDQEQDKLWLKSNAKENRKISIKELNELVRKFDYVAERHRLQEKKHQIMKDGQEFFRAETIANCFETELKDQILYMHAGETFERYSRLLTKKIIADLLDLNIDNARDYLIANRIDYVVSTGITEYKRRVKELDLDGVINKEKIDETRDSMHRILCGVKNEIAKGQNIKDYTRQFNRSIKSDLGLVYAAFTKRFSARKVVVLSEDRDVKELVDYLNLARQAGKITARNKVIQYATRVAA